MKHLPSIAAVVIAGGLLALQIVLGLEYTEGGTLGTRASMIAAMITLAALPVFVYLAVRSRQVIAAGAFTISFLALLAYSLPATTGRTGEIKETKALAAADLALVKAELGSITKTLNWARPDMLSECVGAPNPLPPNGWPKCRAKTGTVAALEDRQAKLEDELKAGRSMETGDLGSDIWAWALAPLGVTAETVRKASVLAFAVGLEFAIWALVAFGSHGWIRAITETAPGKITDAEIEELKELVGNDPGPLPPTKAIDPARKGAEVILWAKAFRAKHGRPARLDEVRSAFPEVPRTTAWRRMKAA